jgi:hypothetical protein
MVGAASRSADYLHSVAGCIGAVAMAFYLFSRDLSPLSVGIFSVWSGLL